MSELPSSWLLSRVGDLFDTVGGGTPSTGVAEFWQGLVPWISSADIDEAHNLSISRFISEEAVSSSATNLVPAGSVIVVTRVGLGKVAINDVPLCFSQDHQALLVDDRFFDRKYVLHYMSTAVQTFKQIGRGTTISGVTKKQLLETNFVLPPLKEQTRIVAEIEKQFSRLDAATAALKRVQTNLKRYRASVLKAACEGQLVPTEAELARKEGRDYEPADELLERILRERRARWEADTLAKMIASGKPPKDDRWKQKYKEPSAPDTTGLPVLPEGWCWTRAEQICDFITKGTTPSAGRLFHGHGDIPFIKVYNLTKTGRLDFAINPTFVEFDTHRSELARSRVFPGDVLMNIVGPPLGKVSVVPDDFAEWNINQAIAVFRPICGLLNSYFAACLMSEYTIRWAQGRAKATAGQFNLTLEICRDLPVPLPPLQEQRRIVGELERLVGAINRLTLSGEVTDSRSSQLRNAILESAFSGKLVPQDPADEPASLLLERMRADRGSATAKARRRPREKHTVTV